MVYFMVYSNTVAFDVGLQDLPNGAGLPEMGSSSGNMKCYRRSTHTLSYIIVIRLILCKS